MKNEAELFPLR